MKYLLTILVLCGLAFSQDANVVQLAPQDSDYAQKIYQSKVAADKAWDDLKDAVFHMYLKDQPSFSHGYNNGTEFDFSKDFKSVVPHTFTPTCCYTNGWSTNCGVTLSPPITLGTLPLNITSQ